ncbi:MAG: (Fe-S)-binding protein [bacterium]
MSAAPEVASRFREYTRTLDCVHCGLCLPHCPTYGVTGREADSPRGRIHLMRGWAESRLEISSAARQRLDSCIVCRNCESVCPSGIRMGEMMEAFREQANAAHPTDLAARPFAHWLMRSVLPNRNRIATLTDALEVYERSGLARLVGAVLRPLSPSLAKLHDRRPPVPPRRLRRLETDRGRPGGFPARGPRRARVALFLGCVASEWLAPVHRATIRVLNRNGCDVVVPDAQTCCGALLRHAGFAAEAKPMLEQNARVFAALGVDAVIVNAAGCGASLKEPLDADLPKPPYRDVMEFLHGLGLVAPDRAVPRRVAYDQPCHLVHAQKVGRDVVEGLLARIPGLELRPLSGSERCCGAGGVYNVIHPEMAEPVLADKVRAIRASGCDVVATGNPGCALQIGHGLRGTGIEVLHPVELLDAAYGASDSAPGD